MRIRSALGTGTTVVVRLPAARGGATDGVAEVERPASRPMRRAPWLDGAFQLACYETSDTDKACPLTAFCVTIGS